MQIAPTCRMSIVSCHINSLLVHLLPQANARNPPFKSTKNLEILFPTQMSRAPQRVSKPANRTQPGPILDSIYPPPQASRWASRAGMTRQMSLLAAGTSTDNMRLYKTLQVSWNPVFSHNLPMLKGSTISCGACRTKRSWRLRKLKQSRSGPFHRRAASLEVQSIIIM